MKRTEIVIQLALFKKELIETGTRLGENLFEVLKFSLNFIAFSVNKRTNVTDICFHVEFGVHKLKMAF